MPPQKILMVEDDAPDRVLIKKSIHEKWMSAEITESTSMESAYKILSKSPRFDLILLDLNLPDAYGPATVRQIRELNKRCPIFVLTNLSTDIAVNECLKEGANHVCLKKDLLSNNFTNLLEKYLPLT